VKIATWNVNGIRARHEQVLAWMEQEQPDVVCLQEIKALREQVPATLLELPGYCSYWHGGKGYSGVALLVRQEFCPAVPAFAHPPFDLENRIVTAVIGDVTVASIYVPNGGKDFGTKLRFLESMIELAETYRQSGDPLVLCGDLNVAHTDQDVHPKERRECIGQSPGERALMDRLLASGLVDLGRALDPHNEGLFTWWAPWRGMRKRNIGWRLDYILASTSLAQRAGACVVAAEIGTSDHAPVVATFAMA
jgi:exodeoxyribonuclease III